MKSTRISEEDFRIIAEQLGRPPEGAIEVMVRDSQSLPAVFRTHPIVRQKPFPNLYWLSHPALKKEIDRLEATGLIKTLERKTLPQSPQLREKLVSAHKSYIQKRLHYLEREFSQTELEDFPPPFLQVFKSRGIGGIVNFHRVRCLHMHYAHHLVDGNPIGKYLDQHFPHLQQIL